MRGRWHPWSSGSYGRGVQSATVHGICFVVGRGAASQVQDFTIFALYPVGVWDHVAARHRSDQVADAGAAMHLGADEVDQGGLEGERRL